MADSDTHSLKSLKQSNRGRSEKGKKHSGGDHDIARFIIDMIHTVILILNKALIVLINHNRQIIYNHNNNNNNNNNI